MRLSAAKRHAEPLSRLESRPPRTESRHVPEGQVRAGQAASVLAGHLPRRLLPLTGAGEGVLPRGPPSGERQRRTVALPWR
jgi:hypothetical protein